MKRNTKIFCAALALVLVFGAVVGGTLAWLMDVTDPIENVFTVGDITIDLKESDDLVLKMIPGEEIKKDPVVSVVEGSEACWLFVEIKENELIKDYIEYSVRDEWTKLEDGVYYKELNVQGEATELEGSTHPVLVDDKVSVKGTVTADMMETLEPEEAEKPTLTFTAYACQRANFDTAADAWTELNKPVVGG